MDLHSNLNDKSADKYGELSLQHCLEIYKLYLEMADRISARRQTANSYFLSINTAVIAMTSYLRFGDTSKSGSPFFWIVSIAGMILCYQWYRLIRSYKDLNSAKFKVIHQIEEHLPLRSYDAEWEALGRGKNPRLYLPFTNIEQRVPWVFFILHAIVFFIGSKWFTDLLSGFF